MKERGAIQLQFMKTRNSAGVGQKVDLDFNVDSLRITDAAEGTIPETAITGNNILAKIKRSTKPDVGAEPPPTAGAKKDMLKDLMAKINSQN